MAPATHGTSGSSMRHWMVLTSVVFGPHRAGAMVTSAIRDPLCLVRQWRRLSRLIRHCEVDGTLEHHVSPPSMPSTGVILAGQDELPPEYPCPTIKHHQTRNIEQCSKTHNVDNVIPWNTGWLKMGFPWNGFWLVVRPHQVLHHQASHLVVHEVPQQLILKHSPFEASLGASIWKYLTAQPKLLMYFQCMQCTVKSYWLPQHERTWCWCGTQCAIQPSTAAPRPGVIPVWAASIRHVAHHLWLFTAPVIGAVKYLQFWFEWYTVPYCVVITSKGISGRGDDCCDEVACPSRGSPGRAWSSSMRTLRSSASI